MLYTVVDIETTGNGYKGAKITEISIFVFDGKIVVDEFTSLVNPEQHIPAFITNLTGITNAMVRNAPKFFEIAKKVEELTKDAVFVAHNVNFDYNIIHEEFKNLLDGGSDRFPTSKNTTLGDAGRVKFNAPNTGGILSDSTLNILTSKNNPVTEVRFRDCFPISLSSLQYNQQATDTDYLTATVTFEYKIYDFANSNASRTTITTS